MKELATLVASALSGILNYFLGVFGSDKLFYPGFDEPFVAWKVMFAFLAAATIFVGRLKGGLLAVFLIGVASSVLLGLNYKSEHALPPISSATDMSWFSYQLAQSCFVGVAVRLIATLSGLLPKKKDTE